MTSPTELTYFTVTGNWWNIEAPDPSGSTNQPLLQVVSAFVTFTPRLPTGFVARIPNLDLPDGTHKTTGVPIAPITARILEGQLQTINRVDTPDLQLVSYSAPIAATLTAQNIDSLIYDVTFDHVVYAEAGRAIQAFAFTAPTGSSTIDLNDPNLVRLPWLKPK